MGIAKNTIRLIARTLSDKKICGKCITFGVHGIEGSYREVKRILADERYPYRELADEEIIFDNITQFGRTIHQSVLFKMLGFTTVDSLDISPKEKTTFKIDINESISKALWGQYDCVYDGGTSEHCFDVKNVLSNVTRLLKIGGRVVHHVPISGVIDHGYYQFSPILFFDFYKANGFTECEAQIQIVKFNEKTRRYSEKLYCFDYNSFPRRSFPSCTFVLPNFHNSKIIMLFFTAKKSTDIINIKNPYQGIPK